MYGGCIHGAAPPQFPQPPAPGAVSTAGIGHGYPSGRLDLLRHSYLLSIDCTIYWRIVPCVCLWISRRSSWMRTGLCNDASGIRGATLPGVKWHLWCHHRNFREDSMHINQKPVFDSASYVGIWSEGRPSGKGLNTGGASANLRRCDGPVAGFWILGCAKALGTNGFRLACVARSAPGPRTSGSELWRARSPWKKTGCAQPHQDQVV